MISLEALGQWWAIYCPQFTCSSRRLHLWSADPLLWLPPSPICLLSTRTPEPCTSPFPPSTFRAPWICQPILHPCSSPSLSLNVWGVEGGKGESRNRAQINRFTVLQKCWEGGGEIDKCRGYGAGGRWGSAGGTHVLLQPTEVEGHSGFLVAHCCSSVLSLEYWAAPQLQTLGALPKTTRLSNLQQRARQLKLGFSRFPGSLLRNQVSSPS